jgi:hypothetical protein
MGDEEKMAELKANQKAFARALYNGDKHFHRLDENIYEIKSDVIKVNHAIFGNGTKGMKDTLDLIFQKVELIEKNCVAHSGCKEKVAKHDEIYKETKEAINEIKKHSDIVKGAKGVIFLFKLIGIGTLSLIILYGLRLIINILGG